MKNGVLDASVEFVTTYTTKVETILRTVQGEVQDYLVQVRKLQGAVAAVKARLPFYFTMGAIAITLALLLFLWGEARLFIYGLTVWRAAKAAPELAASDDVTPPQLPAGSDGLRRIVQGQPMKYDANMVREAISLARGRGERPNLSGHDLSYLMLEHDDLHDVNFSRTDLSRTDFVGANLAGADLSDAELLGTVFREREIVGRQPASGLPVSGGSLRRRSARRESQRNEPGRGHSRFGRFARREFAGGDVRRLDLLVARLRSYCCGGREVVSRRPTSLEFGA